MDFASSAKDVPVGAPSDRVFLQPTILDQMHDAIIVTNMRGLMTGRNLAVTQVYGYTATERIGQSVEVLYSAQDRHLPRSMIVPAVRRTGDFRGRVTNKTRSGDTIYVHLVQRGLRRAAQSWHPPGSIRIEQPVNVLECCAMPTPNSMLTPREAARLLGISYPTIKQWILTGKLASTQTPGGHHRIAASTLKPFLAKDSARPEPDSRARFRRVSGRNQLAGKIISVRIEGLLAEVVLSTGTAEITAIITANAARELQLKKGDHAAALIKSTDVMIERL